MISKPMTALTYKRNSKLEFPSKVLLHSLVCNWWAFAQVCAWKYVWIISEFLCGHRSNYTGQNSTVKWQL